MISQTEITEEDRENSELMDALNIQLDNLPDNLFSTKNQITKLINNDSMYTPTPPKFTYKSPPPMKLNTFRNNFNNKNQFI